MAFQIGLNECDSAECVCANYREYIYRSLEWKYLIDAAE